MVGNERRLAGWTGLEPAASGVTGRRSNQLNYHPKLWMRTAKGSPLSRFSPAVPGLPAGARRHKPSGEGWWAVQGSNLRHPACKAGALPTELTARLRPREPPGSHAATTGYGGAGPVTSPTKAAGPLSACERPTQRIDYIDRRRRAARNANPPMSPASARYSRFRHAWARLNRRSIGGASSRRYRS